MIEVNEYFNGSVKSLTVNSRDGKKTVGVMEESEFEFETQRKETMTILSGSVSVFLPEYNEWEDFDAGSSFDVPAGSKYRVRVREEAAYLCEYE